MNKSIKTLFIKKDLLKYLLVMYFNTSEKFKCKSETFDDISEK